MKVSFSILHLNHRNKGDADAIDLQELPERRRWRQMLPLLAKPGTTVVCLEDGGRGTILEISEMAGHLAYLVQLETGSVRLVLATDMDSATH